LLDYEYQKKYPIGMSNSVAIQKAKETERKELKKTRKAVHVLIFSANKCIARRRGLVGT